MVQRRHKGLIESGWRGGPDWITLAVERARSSELSASQRRAMVQEARTLLEQARKDGAVRASIPHALELIGQAPNIDALQTIAARLILESGDQAHALSCFREILSRFPGNGEAFRLYVRLVRRTSGTDAALTVIEEHFPGSILPLGDAELVMLSAGLEEVERSAEAEHALGLAVELAPQAAKAWRELARLQEKRGALHEAERTLERGARLAISSTLGVKLTQLRRRIRTLESLSDADAPHEDTPMSLVAIDFVLRDVLRDRPNASELRARSHIGSIMLVGGSLGSGGAERQLVTMATALQSASNEAIDIDGVDILGPVQVCIRSLNPRQGNDFFAPTLAAAGVPLSTYQHLEPYGGHIRASLARRYLAAIEFLPTRAAEGMIHLVDHFRETRPEAVQIWQDGMVLAAGLAALVAQVPRIVLMMRTLPPTERVNRWKLEYEPLLRGLLRAPGVVLTANSSVAARGYERWLGLPSHSVPVIHNGLAPLDALPMPEDDLRWQAFEQHAGTAGFTAGGIMRLDENKRPLDWIEIAAEVHAARPDARFVIVGEGPLAEDTADYAARLGLHERILFVGRSRSVGFWLSKMDALLLTSRFEGTPNVLVEAQMAGVPVVTTPAGGASETLRHGVSGFVLEELETIDPGAAAARVLEIAALPANERDAMRTAAREHAATGFGIETMLRRATAVMAMDLSRPLLADQAVTSSAVASATI